MLKHTCTFKRMWEQSDGAVDFADTCLVAPLVEMKNFCSFVDENVFYYFENNFGQCYYCLKEMQEASNAGFRDFSDKSFSRKYFLNSKKAINRTKVAINLIRNSNPEEYSDEKLYDLTKKSGELIIELLTYFTACQPQCVAKLEDELRDYVSSKVPPSDISEVLLTITASDKQTDLNIEELEWLNIVKSAILEYKLNKENINRNSLEIKKTKLAQKISAHAKKYYLLGIADGSNPWDENHFWNLLKQDINRGVENIEKRILKIRNSLVSSSRERKSIYNKYNFDNHYIELAKLIADIAHNRLVLRIGGWMPLYFLFKRKISPEISRRQKLPLAYIRSLTLNELLSFLKGKKIDQKELGKRSKCFWYGLESGKLKIYSGDEAKSIKRKLVSASDLSKINSVSGVTAMPGIAEGEAVVFNWNDKDLNEKMFRMKSGQILIAGQTRPMLMPAIRKAAAIVVDEGGIISHAAIVSRELGIPSIVGAGIATNIFKDGDRVRVDAERGIAEKLGAKSKIRTLTINKKKEAINKEPVLKQSLIRAPYILDLENAKGKTDLVGTKAANLAKIITHYNVPAGFCITSHSFSKAIEEKETDKKIKSILSNTDFKNEREVYKSSQLIYTLFDNLAVPKDLEEIITKEYKIMRKKAVAVRSSAIQEDQPNASFAGQLDTFLNVSGKDKLMRAIKKCWASIYSPRSILYRDIKGYDQISIVMGVLVQEMIDSKYSGVGFSIDPTATKRQNDTLLFEITEGLGDKLVSGEIDPNRYFLTKDRLRVKSKNEVFIFDRDLLKRLARATLELEDLVGYPVDIEFAIDHKNIIWILQIRPVSTYTE